MLLGLNLSLLPISFLMPCLVRAEEAMTGSGFLHIYAWVTALNSLGCSLSQYLVPEPIERLRLIITPEWEL